MKQNKCLIAIIIISTALVVYGRGLASYGYEAPEKTDAAPSVVLAVLSLREGIFPWNMERQEPIGEILPEPSDAQAADVASGESEIRIAEGAGEALQQTAPAETEAETGLPEEVEEAEDFPPELIEVGEEYFADALFIGDSRVVGLWAYAPLEGATYYARTAMTVNNMMESRVETDEETETVLEGLEAHQFGKIYLKVGINEIGTGNVEYFVSHYRERIEELRELQPEALIYIQSIMHVDAQKDATEPYINNTVINERNEGLRQLAEEIGAIYLDLNEAYDDEEGCLPDDMTGDGVHLYAQYYTPWREYLLAHACPWEAELTDGDASETAAGDSGADVSGDGASETAPGDGSLEVPPESAPGQEKTVSEGTAGARGAGKKPEEGGK